MNIILNTLLQQKSTHRHNITSTETRSYFLYNIGKCFRKRSYALCPSTLILESYASSTYNIVIIDLHQWLTFCGSRTPDENFLDTADTLPIFFEYELRRIKSAADPGHEYYGPPGGRVIQVKNR